jgi:hypothetical protein
VKPYGKSNKNDFLDAEAMAEAVGRPKMRFVPIKTDDQLDLQSLHRVRERWVMLARQSSTRFADYCWNVALLCGRDGTMCMPLYRSSWKTPTRSYPAQCACCWPN